MRISGRRQSEGLKHKKYRFSRAPENNVRRTEKRIVAVLAKLQGFHRKTYTFPAQPTILGFLKKWYGVTMSRRALGRHMNTLEAGLWLSRTRRLEYRRRRGLMFRSNLYHLGHRYVAQIRNDALAVVRALTAAARTSGRVPNAAQYLKDFLEDLSRAAHLSTGPPAATARSRPPR